MKKIANSHNTSVRQSMNLSTSTFSAKGEKSLAALLASLKVSLHPETFVFSTVSSSAELPSSLQAQMSFRENEGLTIITTQTAAELHHLKCVFPCRMITLDVHSSLEAVGFIAFVAGKLSEKGIAVNPVSGFYHDHLFVPYGTIDKVTEILQNISAEARRDLET